MREVFKSILREVLFDNKCSCCFKSLDREGFLCSECLKKLLAESYLKNSGNFYYIFYYDEQIRQLIADYKLRNRKNLGKDLAFLIKKSLENLIKNEKIDIIIPVPISKERYKERGFNQVEYILDILKIEYERLERIKNTKHMYGLENYDLRRKNVEGAFFNNLDLSNKKILIVDDIVTSGATVYSIIKEIEKNNINTDIKVFSIAISKSFMAK
ncbi:MAG: ComF family protein [Fusobacterium sp.]|nr:ComF family protein [Fusobacterium sp.]